MSMDSPPPDAIQPSPSSCDEREKQQEPVSKSESESGNESEPIELDWDWESKSLEYLKEKYDNDPCPRFFMCPKFVYKNDAMIKEEEDREKAIAEYTEISAHLSPFDAIHFPQLENVKGHNYPQPIDITDDHDARTRLIRLSKLALDKYNAKKKKGPKYDFDDLVKATSPYVPLGTYYITFNAKPKHAPSNRPATTFQAHVRNKISGAIVVKSCSIKT